MSDVLYGLNPAFEAIRAGRRTLHRLLLNRSSEKQPRLRKLADLAESRHVPIDWVEKGRLIDRCGSREHQGAVLEVGAYPYVALPELLTKPRLVLLDNLEDPHNVGAIIRTAEVLGFAGVLLPTRGVPPILPSVTKASAGATEHMAISRESSANLYVREAQEAGYFIVALDGGGTCGLSDPRLAAAEKLLLVCGGEDRGVRQFILNSADAVVRIPQRGRTGSLNASVAAGIALHALVTAVDG